MKLTTTRDMYYVLKVNEVAKFLRVTEDCVYSLIKNGKLEAIKIGNSYRITKDDVLNLFQH